MPSAGTSDTDNGGTILIERSLPPNYSSGKSRSSVELRYQTPKSRLIKQLKTPPITGTLTRAALNTVSGYEYILRHGLGTLAEELPGLRKEPLQASSKPQWYWSQIPLPTESSPQPQLAKFLYRCPNYSLKNKTASSTNSAAKIEFLCGEKCN